MEVSGIKYSKPEVVLLQQTGIGTAEYAARTCYDSFENSENDCVPRLQNALKDEDLTAASYYLSEMNNIDHSELLDTLAWTHFHHSILEHANLTFLVKGTSRGVLQEHARHRIQAISVRSTRYTMSSVINAYVASKRNMNFFITKFLEMNMLVAEDEAYNDIEATTLFNKLKYQEDMLGHEEFIKLAIAKSSIPALSVDTSPDVIFKALESGKKKRNVGDAFKHIVTDNWKVDMIVTMNLRALKNYLDLRDSGAAFFQIRWLAQAIKEVTPKKYLDLIVKSK